MLLNMRLSGLSGKQLPALGMLYIRIDGEKRKAKCVDVTAVAAGETLAPSVMDALDGILRASGVWPV
jgi:hypothetical protein